MNYKTAVSICTSESEVGAYTALGRDDCNLKRGVEEIIVTLDVVKGVVSFLGFVERECATSTWIVDMPCRLDQRGKYTL